MDATPTNLLFSETPASANAPHVDLSHRPLSLRESLARHYRKWYLRYSLAIASVLVAHVVAVVSWQILGPAIYTVLLAAVVISAFYGGHGPGLVATVLASMDLDYTFMVPYNSFAVNFENIVYLLAFLMIALLTSTLQARRRTAEELLRASNDDLDRRVKDRTLELIRSQEQLSLLVNGVTDQAFFMLDNARNIISWNDGAQRLLGYTADGVLGNTLKRIWPDAAVNTFGRNIRFEHQDWMVRADATRFWANIVLTRIQDPAGEPRGYAMALRDMTEHQSLEREILEISERERDRIGHDLHDGLGQELTGVALMSTALAERMQTADQDASSQAEQVADLVHEAIQHTRELARGLCGVDLEDQGLGTALQQMTRRMGRLPNLECICEVPAQISVDADVASHLYRIAQEGVSNAVRHGRARQIVVRLKTADQRISLSVIDDGVGFPDHPRTTGMGLRLMSYRARAIRGSLDIRRRQAGGTTLTCVVDSSRTSTHE